MRAENTINRIIEDSLPSLSSGEASLESILSQYPELTDELRPRLEAALWLSNLKETFAPRPGFITNSRNYLAAKIETLPPRGYFERLFSRISPQRLAFSITSTVLILLLLGMILNSFVLSARLSIPGDPLYSSKLALEDIRLALTFNQVNKANLYIQYSRERTIEFVDLVLEGEYASLPKAAARMESEIIASLHSMNKIHDQGLAAEQPLTADFRETLSNEIFMLDVLHSSAPPSAWPEIELAVQAAQSGLLALR